PTAAQERGPCWQLTSWQVSLANWQRVICLSAMPRQMSKDSMTRSERVGVAIIFGCLAISMLVGAFHLTVEIHKAIFFEPFDPSMFPRDSVERIIPCCSGRGVFE